MPSSKEEVLKELQKQFDDIDKALSQLMDIKKSYRGPGTERTFKSKATSEINRYLSDINNETKIPKN